MKTLVTAAMLLALASPAFAAKAARQDFNERCYYNGWTDDEDEKSIGKACAAAAKLEKKLAAAPKGEWFLILDAWTCSTRSCADPAKLYKNFDRDGAYANIATRDTFATRKQCLAKGRHVIKLFNDIYHSDKSTDDTVFDTEDGRTLSEAMEAHINAGGLTIGGFHPRCEWHH